MKSVAQPARRFAGVLAITLLAAGLSLASPVAGFADTEPVTASLAAPTGLTPDDSAAAYPHPVRSSVRLDWAPVAGATGYRVQVGTDDTWSGDPVLTQDVYYSEFTLPVSLPNATYVWRVAALKGDLLGHWSSERGLTQTDAQFTKGWRQAPTLNAIAPFEARPTYSWSPVPGASGYELEISTKPWLAGTSSGPSPDTSPSPGTQTETAGVDTCFTPRTRVTPASDVTLPGEAGKSDTVGDCVITVRSFGETVYWRVRALDAFASDAVTGATSPAYDEGVSSGAPTGYPSSALPEPLLASAAGAWSAVSSFTYSSTASARTQAGPLVVTDSLGSDPDHSCSVTNAGSGQAEHALCRDVPTFTWAAVPGTTRYRVTIALDDAFTNIQHVEETSATQATFAGAWPEASAATSYYYAVQSCDDTGCGAITSTPPSFSKVTPRLVLGTAPDLTDDLTLRWQSYADALKAATGHAPTMDAVKYNVEIAKANDPSYASPVLAVSVDETYLTPLTNIGDGDFVWRVQPVDSHADTLPWSFSQSFTRDATKPKIASITPSARVGVLQSMRLTFSETVTGLTASSVTLTPSSPVTLSVTGPATATLKPTSPLVPGTTYTVHVASSVVDLAGNSAVAVGPTFTVNPVIDDKSAAFTYTGTWRTLSATDAVGGTYHGSTPTTSARTTATSRFSGTAVTVTSCMGPALGYLDVVIDGSLRRHVSTYRSFSGCGVKVASVTGLAKGFHTVKLVGTGTKVLSSRGTSVAVDAVTVTP